MPVKHRPLTLIILDGFGFRETDKYNAIRTAKTPHWDRIWRDYPHTLIDASGHAVGLPNGQMGNSEVGHMNIGAGRVIYQDFTRIEKAIAEGDFFKEPVLLNSLAQTKQTGKAVHIMGLLSAGGVHSHEAHLHAAVKLAAEQHLQHIYVHAFLDGRDTPPQSALASIQALEALFETLKVGQFASITGRYYAMDRDQRWERTQACYDLLTLGQTHFYAANAEHALTAAYTRGETDEFVKPTAIAKDQAHAITINDGDVVIFMNYRSDRARQLTRAFTDPNFKGFARQQFPQVDFISLTQYADDINAKVIYPPQLVHDSLGEHLAKLGLRQLRIAETEKYAHVTFFFNGGMERVFTGEERILVPSPKIATYDLQPAMSAPELTQQLIATINSQRYDVIICNYANPDMVGHTGDFTATVEAIETIDDCLGKVLHALHIVGGEAIITADHGNAECMYDEATQQPHTAHTSDLVPFVYIGRPATINITDGGVLADVAPTMLGIMGLAKPAAMTGRELLEVVHKE